MLGILQEGNQITVVMFLLKQKISNMFTEMYQQKNKKLSKTYLISD